MPFLASVCIFLEYILHFLAQNPLIEPNFIRLSLYHNRSQNAIDNQLFFKVFIDFFVSRETFWQISSIFVSRETFWWILLILVSREKFSVFNYYALFHVKHFNILGSCIVLRKAFQFGTSNTTPQNPDNPCCFSAHTKCFDFPYHIKPHTKRYHSIRFAASHIPFPHLNTNFRLKQKAMLFHVKQHCNKNSLISIKQKRDLHFNPNTRSKHKPLIFRFLAIKVALF